MELYELTLLLKKLEKIQKEIWKASAFESYCFTDDESKNQRITSFVKKDNEVIPSDTSWVEQVASIVQTKKSLQILKCISEPPLVNPKASLDFLEEYGTDAQIIDLLQEPRCLSSVYKLVDDLGVESLDLAVFFGCFHSLKYPWVAAQQISRCLTIGGVALIQTYFSHPLIPNGADHFRYTSTGLESLFSKELGLQTIVKEHEFPSMVSSTREPLTALGSSYLNTIIAVQKVGITPEHLDYANIS